MATVKILTKEEDSIQGLMAGSRYREPMSREEAIAFLENRNWSFPYNDRDGWVSLALYSDKWTHVCSAKFFSAQQEVKIIYPPEGDSEMFPCLSKKQAVEILRKETISMVRTQMAIFASI